MTGVHVTWALQETVVGGWEKGRARLLASAGVSLFFPCLCRGRWERQESTQWLGTDVIKRGPLSGSASEGFIFDSPI